MVCVYRQKALGKLVGGGSQTTPIACAQDNRFHNELRLIAIVLFHLAQALHLPLWQVARQGGSGSLGNKRKPRQNQEEPTVEDKKRMLPIADRPSFLGGRFGATLPPA